MLNLSALKAFTGLSQELLEKAITDDPKADKHLLICLVVDGMAQSLATLKSAELMHQAHSKDAINAVGEGFTLTDIIYKQVVKVLSDTSEYIAKRHGMGMSIKTFQE